MKRQNRKLWDIVPKTVRDKVAHLWPDANATVAYLCTRAQTTLDNRNALQEVAARVGSSDRWASPRAEADTDLARVYAFAAWHVHQCHTYEEFRCSLNRIRVGTLAARLEASEGWSADDMSRAGTLLQDP